MLFILELAERLTEIIARLKDIQKTLRSIKRTEETEMATLADIRAKVEAEHEVTQSAVTLLEQLSQMLRDAMASGDPAAIQQIADMLDAERQTLADAVVANTPAAP